MVKVVSSHFTLGVVLLDPSVVPGGPTMLSTSLGTMMRVHMGVGGKGKG